MVMPSSSIYDDLNEKRTTQRVVELRYWDAINDLAKRLGYVTLRGDGGSGHVWTRDGIHATPFSQLCYAGLRAYDLGCDMDAAELIIYGKDKQNRSEILPNSKDEQLRQLITTKNRLWFNYWRVQNWAFLAGDRTEQPSSRDWRDPSKRWFPAEREKFLPLIEKKEQEIWALAAKLAQP